MVQQHDYRIRSSVARRRRKQPLISAILLDARVETMLGLGLRYRKAQRNVRKLLLHRLDVRSDTFNLNSYSNEQCLHDFHFRLQDIGKVSDAIGWNSVKARRNRYLCDSITVSCIFLRRLSVPYTWYDRETVLGMRSSAHSKVFGKALVGFVGSKRELLSLSILVYCSGRAPLYTEYIHKKGSRLDKCVVFIDCSKIKMAHSGGGGSNQRACYLGHKGIRCFCYQTITTPDGLMFSLHGLDVGRRHDITLLHSSGVEQQLDTSLLINGTQYYIHGDSSYIVKPWLQVAFDGSTATEKQRIFNMVMSAVRVAVKWNYMDLKKRFYKKRFTVESSKFATPLQRYCYILRNAQKYTDRHAFSRSPPTFNEYLEE